MSRSRKKTWTTTTTTIDFQPDWKRYIFFKSLNDSEEASQQSVGEYFQSSVAGALSGIMNANNSLEKEDGIILYIDQFITQLEHWADNELSSEEQFLQMCKEQGVEIEEYYTNGKFSYENFILDLNLAFRAKEDILKILTTHSKNLHIVENALNEYKVDTTKRFTKKDGDVEVNGEVISKESILKNKNFHELGKVRQGMKIVLDSYAKKNGNDAAKLSETNIQEEINRLNDNISSILLSNKVIDAVDSLLVKGVEQTKIRDKIFNILLKELPRQNPINPWVSNVIDSVTNGIANLATEEVEETYTNAITFTEKTAEDIINTFIERSYSSAEGLEALFRQFPSEEIQNSLLQSTGVNKAYQALLDRMKTEGATARSIGAYKGKLSIELKKEMMQRFQSVKTDLTEYKENVLKSFTQLSGGQYRLNAKNFLNSCIDNFEISGANMAEIDGAIEQELRSNGLTALLPGKTIQLKNDIVISYRLTPVKYEEVSDIITMKQYDKINRKMENFGKNFLRKYNQATKGYTKVTTAQQKYINELQSLAKEQREILSKATSSEERAKLEKMFKFLNTSISVKEYEDTTFSNTGFHGGSLGGGGKVVDAVPNIVAMLDAGGITTLDAQTIIAVLLNTFSDSAIGRAYEQPLTNYLVGGAAMMLFDDGFANGENFLQSIKEQFSNSPSALHLLRLDSLYFPQSYILRNICENLRVVYNDIQESYNRITSEKISTSLQLDNPLTMGLLASVPNKKKQVTRWNQVRKQAEKQVKINLLFMAGMLDIIDSLKTKLENAVNNPK